MMQRTAGLSPKWLTLLCALMTLMRGKLSSACSVRPWRGIRDVYSIFANPRFAASERFTEPDVNSKRLRHLPCTPRQTNRQTKRLCAMGLSLSRSIANTRNGLLEIPKQIELSRSLSFRTGLTTGKAARKVRGLRTHCFLPDQVDLQANCGSRHVRYVNCKASSNPLPCRLPTSPRGP